jgi:hypothetical protein
MPLARGDADINRRRLYAGARHVPLSHQASVRGKNHGLATCSIDKVMFNNYLSSYSNRSFALQGHNND